jgi:hypothetical protein
MRVNWKAITLALGFVVVLSFATFVYPTRYFYWNEMRDGYTRRMRQDRFTGRVGFLGNITGCGTTKVAQFFWYTSGPQKTPNYNRGCQANCPA